MSSEEQKKNMLQSDLFSNMIELMKMGITDLRLAENEEKSILSVVEDPEYRGDLNDECQEVADILIGVLNTERRPELRFVVGFTSDQLFQRSMTLFHEYIDEDLLEDMEWEDLFSMDQINLIKHAIISIMLAHL